MILPFLELYYMQCIIEAKWFVFYVDFKLKTLSTLMKSDFSVKHFHLTLLSVETLHVFLVIFWYAAKGGDAPIRPSELLTKALARSIYEESEVWVFCSSAVSYIFNFCHLLLLLWNQISMLLFVSVLKCCSVGQNKVKWLVTDLVGTECDGNEVVRFFLAFIFMSGLDSTQLLRDWVRVCN